MISSMTRLLFLVATPVATHIPVDDHGQEQQDDEDHAEEAATGDSRGSTGSPPSVGALSASTRKVGCWYWNSSCEPVA